MKRISLRLQLEKWARYNLEEEDLRWEGLPPLVSCTTQCLLEQLAQLEARMQVGAEADERPPTRQNYHNGYRYRSVPLPWATVRLRLPRLRGGGVVPSFLRPHQRTTSDLEELVLVASARARCVGSCVSRRTGRLPVG